MNIIKNSQTNEVLWYGSDSAYVDNGVYKTVESSLGIAADGATYVENVEPIDHFFYGVYTYDSDWQISNQSAYDVAMKIVTDNAAQKVRAQRNELLQASDWTQGKDVPDGISTPWATYRQVLRDISKQPDFPWTVTWPTAPGDRSQPETSGLLEV